MRDKTPDDGLYAEVEYTPKGVYLWHASLRDDTANTTIISWIVKTHANWRWLVMHRARRMLAKERKQRAQQQRAKEIGKVVIR